MTTSDQVSALRHAFPNVPWVDWDNDRKGKLCGKIELDTCDLDAEEVIDYIQDVIEYITSNGEEYEYSLFPHCFKGVNECREYIVKNSINTKRLKYHLKCGFHPRVFFFVTYHD